MTNRDIGKPHPTSESEKMCIKCRNTFPNNEFFFYRRDRKGKLENICKKCRIRSRPYRLRMRVPKERSK